ncbi:thioredoxin-dependent thiol peroxidase [Saccharomonospora cyanea]|uniref:thioredoxin-dependent peroxiredoxin n=1 Tax=Saccharomonospora cyanea NA-134 TaxID=882082 RepID=H5XF67_9PSEU|nr:thioredoxin-dependent thiol peroxidase [Saccharomonospora cyanea]EHR61477.1 Peroxiredoxin [Saccharomonospora cyanea NA-134]
MRRVRLRRGDRAPEFALPDQNGDTVSPASLRGSKVVIYFYPAAGTPGCTTEACDFRDNLASLRSAGYAVVGISPDSPQRLREWARQERLVYPLLPDEDHVVHQRYGAWGEKTVDGRTRTGPLRSTFVLDEEGVVEHALYDVNAQGHVAELRKLLGV